MACKHSSSHLVQDFILRLQCSCGVFLKAARLIFYFFQWWGGCFYFLFFYIWGRRRRGYYYVRKGRKAQGKYSRLSEWSQHPASLVQTSQQWNEFWWIQSVPTCLSHFTALTLPLRGCCWFSSSTDPHTYTLLTHFSSGSHLKKGPKIHFFSTFLFTHSFPRSQWGQIKACQAGGVTAAAGPSRQRPCDLNQ